MEEVELKKEELEKLTPEELVDMQIKCIELEEKINKVLNNKL